MEKLRVVVGSIIAPCAVEHGIIVVDTCELLTTHADVEFVLENLVGIAIEHDTLVATDTFAH